MDQLVLFDAEPEKPGFIKVTNVNAVDAIVAGQDPTEDQLFNEITRCRTLKKLKIDRRSELITKTEVVQAEKRKLAVLHTGTPYSYYLTLLESNSTLTVHPANQNDLQQTIMDSLKSFIRKENKKLLKDIKEDFRNKFNELRKDTNAGFKRVALRGLNKEIKAHNAKVDKQLGFRTRYEPPKKIKSRDGDRIRIGSVPPGNMRFPTCLTELNTMTRKEIGRLIRFYALDIERGDVLQCRQEFHAWLTTTSEDDLYDEEKEEPEEKESED